MEYLSKDKSAKLRPAKELLHAVAVTQKAEAEIAYYALRHDPI